MSVRDRIRAGQWRPPECGSRSPRFWVVVFLTNSAFPVDKASDARRARTSSCSRQSPVRAPTSTSHRTVMQCCVAMRQCDAVCPRQLACLACVPERARESAARRASGMDYACITQVAEQPGFLAQA